MVLGDHCRVERFDPVASGSARHRSARVLIIDNYDSFTYNLVQLFLELGAAVDVVTHDAGTASELVSWEATHVVLSPGPGAPRDSGVCPDVARRVIARGDLPMLGVCLGHQAICQVMGARVRRADRAVHGKSSTIEHAGDSIFSGLPSGFRVGRYHSLIVEPTSLPPSLRAIATTSQGEIMAVRHTSRPVFGVQFHPESVLTEYGHVIAHNFLSARADLGQGSVS